MGTENVLDWLSGDMVIDPVTPPVSHGMKLREFIPDVRISISLQHDLPSHLCWGTIEKGMRHGKSSGNTFAVGEWFDWLPKRVEERVREAGFVDGFHTYIPSVVRQDDHHAHRCCSITRLPFGGWSMVSDDRMRKLDCPSLRMSLRAAISMQPTIFDQRGRYESIYTHYQEMPQEQVAEMDVDVVARAYIFYLLLTTLFTNYGNDTDLASLPPLQDLDATRQFNWESCRPVLFV
ncbi:hypothetical protein JCGZ_13609 [Jatropha curcas]|uniref:Aminotransferase-like plant mobile domain-containing protein n=1 Tax=Jatropha curcas TaxID=180498 RepID=A0A067KAA3_JATCU|nr:hypothetical protein JCGZ_13609 [Jatropha curcas]